MMKGDLRVRKVTTKNIRRLVDFLSRERKSLSPLLILTHDYPDPDALASSFAFAYLAKKGFNISCQIAYGGIIGRAENQAMVKILKIPIRKFKATDLKKYSNLVLIDTQPEFDNNPFPSERKATIVIDQHPSLEKKPLARLSIIDTECGATSVILAQSLFLTGTEIPKRIGTALAYGILTDTLNLYRAKRSDIIKTYISLLPFCDLRALTQIQNPPRSRRFFVTLEKGIKEALIYGKLIITHLGWVENPDVVSQITEFLLTYEKMRYSFCTGRYKEKLHFSLRAADPNFLAADVLRDIVENPRDAGGHDAIAGGSFFVGKGVSESIWQDTEKNLAQKLIARLKLFPKNKLNSPMRLIG